MEKLTRYVAEYVMDEGRTTEYYQDYRVHMVKLDDVRELVWKIKNAQKPYSEAIDACIDIINHLEGR